MCRTFFEMIQKEVWIEFDWAGIVTLYLKIFTTLAYDKFTELGIIWMIR
jgi:hypothetical protein